MDHAEGYRALPKVDRLAAALDDLPRATATAVARQVQLELRAAIGDGLAASDVPAAQSRALERWRARLRAGPLPSVINATGTVLHTGLGRAPLGERARAAMARVAAGYCQLEFDLERGERGQRQDHVAPLLRLLTGAPAALVVNNCAGATVLALQALAQGRSVVVSRGELVEIGGSFRVPEIMACAGCSLVEVGATNRTRLDDYRAVLDDDTAALLKVHRSNFVQQGFVAEVATAELATLAHERSLPLIVDQGSGCVVDLAAGGFAIARVQDELAAGADLVCCSGDKLLGAPQAGILLGDAELIARCARHPLARALRCDKVTLAGLAATLQDYLLGDPVERVPTLALLLGDPSAARVRAERLRELVAVGEVVASRGAVGSGALPTEGPATTSLTLDGAVEQIHRRLRLGDPPVVGRIAKGRLLIDCGTVTDDQVEPLAAAIRAALDA